jgi:hypothetical protein
MVYFRIRAHCLAHQKEWKKEYEDIGVLKDDIYNQFQLFNINEECGIIVYYHETGKCDCLFDKLDILPTDGTTIFDLYVKRVSYFSRIDHLFEDFINRYGLVVVFVLVHLISYLIVYHWNVRKKHVMFNIVFNVSIRFVHLIKMENLLVRFVVKQMIDHNVIFYWKIFFFGNLIQ